MKTKISINEIERIAKLENIKIHIFDFDYTLTKSCSSSSIGIFNNIICKKYYIKKIYLDYLTNHFRCRSIYKYIWKKKLLLLKKYNYMNYLKKVNIKKEFIPNVKILNLISKIIINKNNRVIIYSSGLECIIKRFLKLNKLDNKGIIIIANNPDNLNSIITPYKNKLKIKEKCMCYGDKETDLNIVNDSINILIKNADFYLK